MQEAASDPGFHPAVTRWFQRALGEPSEAQRAGWPLIAAQQHTLIAAPTGSGKTLAAFLSAIDELLRRGLSGQLEEQPRVLYVSPLKALSNDVEKNLAEPLQGIREELKALGLPDVELRVSVRTGDTAARERAAMLRRPPHILVTTPESLYILLTSRGGRALLGGVRTVIVDEIHALVKDKRGSHLALSLERLEALAPGFVRIGLSATQRPIERVAEFLGGYTGGEPRPVRVVDVGHRRALDLRVEVPRSPLTAVMAGEVWEEIYDRIAELVREHRTTLVFVNTRRVSERVARHLGERLGEGQVASHHGSLSREQRLRSEQRLKAGELKALIATSSLELGIDVGSVTLVCQLGSTRSIATLLQRVGRAGHSLGGLPKGRVFPLSLGELVEQAALLRALAQGELDQVTPPVAPIDVLAQQLVATVAAEEEGTHAGSLFALARSAAPYQGLSEERFEAVIEMLAEGFSTQRGLRGSLIHWDPVARVARPRRAARLTAMTNGGAIPDQFDYEVLAEPNGTFVGTVNEDFAIESMAGDIFQLGNMSWLIRRVEPGRVRVEDARGAPPSIPFWLGEAPPRSAELSRAVSELCQELERALEALLERCSLEHAMLELTRRATTEPLPEPAARQLVEHLVTSHQALGALPTQRTLILERFFDESGGMQLVLHAPLGARIHRAFGLALRKRFCQRFNFELQAAATEDALILSLGQTHSFPLQEVFGYLHPSSVLPLLIQALLVAPMFTTRWRWNASRALAVLRFRGGKRVPPRLQRMNADDLLSLVFPDQVACQENLSGPREVPEHPLVEQTISDCLVEAMDAPGLQALLAAIHAGERRLLARDLTAPSPLALEILSARPYAFLDDAPLEERRTQAVSARRARSPAEAAELGALDPEAITRVQEEAWPSVRDADELADLLSVLGALTEAEGEAKGYGAWFEFLLSEGRATRLSQTLAAHPGGAPQDSVETLAAHQRTLWVAAPRLAAARLIYPGAAEAPPLELPPRLTQRAEESAEAALVELVRGQLECRGPLAVSELAACAGLAEGAAREALMALEIEGFVLRGHVRKENIAAGAEEWCERGLLARVHRYTLTRLRGEIAPVTQVEYVRFLCEWQRITPESMGSGPDALRAVLAQLEGFEAPAAAWEEEILPARVAGYQSAWLDALCLTGEIAWLRRSPPAHAAGARPQAAPVRSTPVALVRRAHVDAWRAPSACEEPRQRVKARARVKEVAAAEQVAAERAQLSAEAAAVRGALEARGASFVSELLLASGLLEVQLERALGELVALGLATSDSFAGLRALLVPSKERLRGGRPRRASSVALSLSSGGRFSLLAPAESLTDNAEAREAATEHVARVLLARWGVVFRRVVEREPGLPAWRELVRVYRRLEARGELRGGRFVAGFTGEQYASPEAVSALRAARRRAEAPLVTVCAADPLNLTGVVLAGERVPALTSNRLCLVGGAVVGSKVGRHIQVEPSGAEAVTVRAQLTRLGAARRAQSPALHLRSVARAPHAE